MVTVTLAVPYNMKLLERKALFSGGPALWGASQSGSLCGFTTCRRRECAGEACSVCRPEPCWSELHCREGPKASLLPQAQDSFISVCIELEKNTMS